MLRTKKMGTLFIIDFSGNTSMFLSTAVLGTGSLWIAFIFIVMLVYYEGYRQKLPLLLHLKHLKISSGREHSQEAQKNYFLSASLVIHENGAVMSYKMHCSLPFLSLKNSFPFKVSTMQVCTSILYHRYK